jgi:hypothetical protein
MDSRLDHAGMTDQEWNSRLIVMFAREHPRTNENVLDFSPGPLMDSRLNPAGMTNRQQTSTRSEKFERK